MIQRDLVVIDIRREYLALERNESIILNKQQVEELFHQIFENMFSDKKVYLERLLILPNFTRVFSHIPNQMDQMSLYKLKETFQSVAMELLFKMLDLQMFNSFNGNPVEFFLIKLDSHTAYLRRCF